MLPFEGLSVWTPLQNHVAKLLKETHSNIIVYQMPEKSGKTTLLHGLIAEAWKSRRNTSILYLSRNHAIHNHVWIKNILGKQDAEKYEEDLWCKNVRFGTFTEPYVLQTFQWVLIDNAQDCPEALFGKIIHLVCLQQMHRTRVLFLYSGTFPIIHKEPFNIVKHVTLYYPTATYNACKTWLLCAKRLGVHKNVSMLIGKLVWNTCHDYETWLSLESADDDF